MFRVTTPTHTFILDTDPREWTEFFITYKQRGIIILELTEANADRMIMEETGITDYDYAKSLLLRFGNVRTAVQSYQNGN